MKLEPARFAFTRVARRFVDDAKYATTKHITHAQGRELIALALGFDGWETLASLSVSQSGDLIESIELDQVSVRLTDIAKETRALVLDPDTIANAFRGSLGYAPTKPASGLYALFDGDAFQGIVMGANSFSEHEGRKAFDLDADRIVARRIISTSPGIVGLDRSYFAVGGHDRLLLDEAVEERLDHLGCVPFASSGYGDQNWFASTPQLLHGGWTESSLMISGNEQASPFVATLGEWQRAGILKVETANDLHGIFVGLGGVLSGARKVLRARFCSGSHDVYWRKDHDVKVGGA